IAPKALEHLHTNGECIFRTIRRRFSTAGFFPFDRLPTDIAPAEALRPVDFVHRRISVRGRLPYRAGKSADIEHATAVGEDPAAIGPGASMKDFDAFDRGRCVKALDH